MKQGDSVPQWKLITRAIIRSRSRTRRNWGSTRTHWCPEGGRPRPRSSQSKTTKSRTSPGTTSPGLHLGRPRSRHRTLRRVRVESTGCRDNSRRAVAAGSDQTAHSRHIGSASASSRSRPLPRMAETNAQRTQRPRPSQDLLLRHNSSSNPPPCPVVPTDNVVGSGTVPAEAWPSPVPKAVPARLRRQQNIA
jgi:hypothetical protein